MLRKLFERQTRHWLWLTVSTLAVGLFLVLTSEVSEFAAGQAELIGKIDERALLSAISFRTQALNGIAVDFTTLGSGPALTTLVIVLCIWFFVTRDRLSVFQILGSSLGAAFITFVLKSFFERSRPELVYRLVDVQGFSYPSGHSLNASAIYFTCAMILSRKAKTLKGKIATYVLFSLLILLIDFTRIYLGVHFVSDVTAGTLLGVSFASFIGSMRLLLERRVGISLTNTAAKSDG